MGQNLLNTALHTPLPCSDAFRSTPWPLSYAAALFTKVGLLHAPRLTSRSPSTPKPSWLPRASKAGLASLSPRPLPALCSAQEHLPPPTLIVQSCRFPDLPPCPALSPRSLADLTTVPLCSQKLASPSLATCLPCLTRVTAELVLLGSSGSMVSLISSTPSPNP